MSAQPTDRSRLERWVAQFGVRQAASRELWKAIYAEFERQGPPMNVRQMFYRMSSTGEVAKTEGGYRKVQYALTVMREAGAIPYGWLADATRWVTRPQTFSSMADMLSQSQKFYRRALWDTQPDYVEIWLEKQALAGVINTVCDHYAVPLYVTRGYPSLSYLYEAAESLRCIGKPIYIYHFGDYDASGKDAARSIRDGLTRFGARFHFEEIAVTAEQISTLGLQTRPAKKSDPRAEQWGDRAAVELDAIAPFDLRRMVQDTIERHIDWYELESLRRIETQEKATLASLIADFRTGTKLGGEA